MPLLGRRKGDGAMRVMSALSSKRISHHVALRLLLCVSSRCNATNPFGTESSRVALIQQ
jgi:hypothetical protein